MYGKMDYTDYKTKAFPAIFLILALIIAAAAMAIPAANSNDGVFNFYIDGPDTNWGMDIGTVTISTNATHVLILLDVGPDWNITYLRCVMEEGTTVDALSDYVNGAGNPKIGKFPCGEEWAAGDEVSSYECAFPLPTDGNVVIAVHAKVQVDESALENSAYDKYIDDVTGLAIPETGWAADSVTGTPGDPGAVGNVQFVTSKSWATYITYTLDG